MTEIVTIYTDGACRGNPGPGGWGALLELGKKKLEICGGEKDSTNNRMELTAVIKGLGALKRSCKVLLITDSKYVLKGADEWMIKWKKSGWKTSNKKPVKNIDLWQELDLALQRHDIQWKWVKGHANNLGNERADELANRGIDELSC